MMLDAFLQHGERFADWKDSGFPDVRPETRDFIERLLDKDKKINMWNHQLEGILRIIYAYEVLGMKNNLLNIVTGGGKTAIIAAVIFWLKSAHRVGKFLILTPNTIVRARLESDFRDGAVFKRFEIPTPQTEMLVNELGLHMMKSGAQPHGMLESGIILGNIQQLYTSEGVNRNLAYLQQFVGDVAVFNDEAHNTPAPEYSNVLGALSTKCRFRLDTTATPNRADGQEPDSEMIYHYDVASALDDGIIKSVVVYQPEVKLLKMTYTNPKTGEKRDVTELDAEFREAEKNLRPFQWILDPEPMRKQIAIALQRHGEQVARARGRYRPILFVVTMSIQEGQRVQKALRELFRMETLLVTEESSDKDRAEALRMGTFESKYEAVVSVLMLREGWDVPEVSTILLLRKFSSPVYGQQIIGRGLRKIIRDPAEGEILAVVDHPRLEHDWLWQIVAVSKIKQEVDENQTFEPGEDLPRPVIQRLISPENLIRIPEATYDTGIDWTGIERDIPTDEIEDDWSALLDRARYDKERWVIARTRVGSVEARELRNRRLEILGGVSDYDLYVSGELKRDVLEDLFKKTLLDVCAGLLQESGFAGMNRAKLYRVMLRHVRDKIFTGRSLSDAERDDIEFAIDMMPEIRGNFTKGIVAGIVED